MEGKRGLVMGVANQNSIAWGIASMLHRHGAEMAFTYQGEATGRRAQPLVESIGAKLILPCDVEDVASLDAVFDKLEAAWGGLDFVVHAIGFSDKAELRGRYVDNTTRENFSRTMVISCYSFTEIAQRAMRLMPNGGSLLTLTYGGSTRTSPNYNVMGVAKAALEASMRYLATDLGPQGIRVNALSPGPVRTLAGTGVAEARATYSFQTKHSPLGRPVTLDEIGGSALWLLSDLGSGVTGEIVYVDGGYNIINMPRVAALNGGAAQAD
jgi:enoyl-[acyl-carrier protein] reductase I